MIYIEDDNAKENEKRNQAATVIQRQFKKRIKTIAVDAENKGPNKNE